MPLPGLVPDFLDLQLAFGQFARDRDFLVCSAYKFYGPHIGALWCRKELLESLPFAKVQPSSNLAPERAETGTLNHEGIAGTAAAVDFLASLATGAGRRHQLQAAYAALDERSAVRAASTSFTRVSCFLVSSTGASVFVLAGGSTGP